ncbi:hypothetical protein BCF74_11415 [Knoellia remsis]|uniref:Glyoxalase/fosfomycin resistance/dioxygenase domain-containing protein n=1 Tax=Knoellia remsis TaxID=407159 RepID=A0A2T0UJD9_9MICO|nr:ArsI/CadI family heavy metal resistance metalloenzyme [Knoellia remsis]PRY57986.1 hypothetical protein BCF74_11415 [Knoellia remsis]
MPIDTSGERHDADTHHGSGPARPQRERPRRVRRVLLGDVRRRAGKRRPGYANFAIAEPPLKLVLIETGEQTRGHGPAGALNHLGVEVSTDEVAAARERFAAAGLAAFDENDTTCCYARQDKVWVHDPAGAPWEVYTVTDEHPADARPATASLEILDVTEVTGVVDGSSSPAASACCR